MAYRLLKISLCLSLLFVAPMSSFAAQSIEIIEQETQAVTISISESTLHITGANGEMLFIYNVAGVRVMSIKIEGPDKRYELNLPKGCYIIKVGKTVRKISIR